MVKKVHLVYTTEKKHHSSCWALCVYYGFRQKQSIKFIKWTKNDAINTIITVICLLKLPIELVGKQIKRGSKFSRATIVKF